MKKDSELTFSIAGFIAVVIILILASCNKKDIQLPKPKPTLFIRIVSVGADTIYSNIIKVK